MRLLADECCDARIVEGLRRAGYDVLYAAEELISETDSVIVRIAYDQDRLVLTEDIDFGALTVRQRLPSRGIILLRAQGSPWRERLLRVDEELARLGDRLRGSLTVIDSERTRIHPLAAE